MGFEVPFRTFISRRITSAYTSEVLFSSAVNGAILAPGLPAFFASESGKIKKDPSHYYKLLTDTVQSCINKCVPNEIDVPYVSTLITLYEIFGNEVNDFMSSFPNHSLLISQMEKLKYVRNKLDHPLSKTLQTEDMYPVLSFVNAASETIFILDEDCFWDKKQEEIEHEVLVLETKTRKNPIAKNNFSVIPFTDNSIVCRQAEIEAIQRFIYGTPGALKKKTSLCIYGYGGVGKTAIVTEAIKVIVRDVIDGKTINGYLPKFILFFSAKKTKLDFSYTSGNIVEETVSSDFSTCSELENAIYNLLQIKSFVGFEDNGIVIIDNLETIEIEERESIRDFVDNRSPQNIQFIITSRNEEPYDERMEIKGFDGKAGIDFIDTYSEENDLDIELSQKHKEDLLNASKGNTLVLVLSLQRLDKRIISVPGIVKDLNQSSVKAIAKEISNIPINGYEIVSEFMFKNTFEELESMYEDKGDLLNSLLRVFAVYPSKCIDIFTICIITELGYQKILPMVDLLCKYLILEKKEEKYSLNPFAEKYIIQKLLPDATASEKLSSDIEKSVAEIKSDLRKLESDLNSNEKVRNIISDWAVDYDGDKIAAAKIYKVYSDANSACQMGDRFHVETSYEEFLGTVKKIETTTMHPYIKYQKARILQLFAGTRVIDYIKPEDISAAYNECIWAIKANSLYSNILSTKTYASILWIYGLFLDSIGQCLEAIRYLENAMQYFTNIDCRDIEYYQCISKLASLYLVEYEKTGNRDYLDRAKPIGRILYDNRGDYATDRNTKISATEIHKKLKAIR